MDLNNFKLLPIDNQKEVYLEIKAKKEAFINKMVHRCTEDVEINTKLFIMQIQFLMKIYGSKEAADRFISYMSFKLDCAREQEEEMWRLDVEKCQENLAILTKEKELKTEVLADIMPVQRKYKIISRPAKLTKKDGEQSEAGKKWFELLKQNNLPEHYTDAVKVLESEERGNPRSPAQLKEWLFSLGWVPDEFAYVKDKKLETVKKIPQVNTKEAELTDSIKALMEANPQLEHLDSLGVLNHRIGLLKGFLESVDSNGFVKATINGFTNTMRFQHSKPCVNLPTIPKKYWEMVRGVLIAKDDKHILCGSDMSSLESNTRNHLIYFFDPQYVKDMQVDGYDSHTDIAKRAGLMTEDEEKFYQWYGKNEDIEKTEEQTKNYKRLKAIRLKSKKVNFGALYGAGISKLALTANISEREAKILHTAYWERNKAVKLISDACIIKEVNGMKWLYNPVSRFWYSLRIEKDKFSTLNQGLGVYCFDIWLRYVRSQGIKLCGQFHDECISCIPKGTEDEVRQKLLNAIAKTNEELKLNIELGISIDFGQSYKDIH